MDYTSFEIPRKSTKDVFLKKFLLKINDGKERLNTENLSNCALTNYLDTEISKANVNTTDDGEKSVIKKVHMKPPIYHSNKNFIDLTKDSETKDFIKIKKIDKVANNRSANKDLKAKCTKIIKTAALGILINKSINSSSLNKQKIDPMKKQNIQNSNKKLRLSINDKPEKKKYVSTNKAKKEYSVRPIKINQSVDHKKVGKKINDRTVSEPKDIGDKNSVNVNKLKEPKIKIEISSKEPNKIHSMNEINQLEFNQKNICELPSFLKNDVEKYKGLSRKTPPFSFSDSSNQNVEKKNNQLIYSFEKGFIKNKYKDLLESLKC